MNKYFFSLGTVVLLCALLASGSAVASTITFTGPEDINGNPCTPGISPSCVIGDPASYEVWSLSITSRPARAGTGQC